jgi:hypothetical protein
MVYTRDFDRGNLSVIDNYGTQPRTLASVAP